MNLQVVHDLGDQHHTFKNRDSEHESSMLVLYLHSHMDQKLYCLAWWVQKIENHNRNHGASKQADRGLIFAIKAALGVFNGIFKSG